MSKKAHYSPKSFSWLVSLIVMIVLSAAVIIGTVAVDKAVTENNSKPVDVDFTIANTIPIAVQENEFNVTGIEKALDAQNNVVAYVVSHNVIGYNQEVPIEMCTTISADASVVCGIDILKQQETEYLGVRIQDEGFMNQFVGKKLPVKSSNSLAKGSNVDVIARSTVSSQAVIDGVNNAMNYVQAFLAE